MYIYILGVPCGSAVKNLPANEGERFSPWVGKILWRRKWPPTPVFLPGKAHGQGNLVACNPQRCKRIKHALATEQQQHVVYRSSVHFYHVFSVFIAHVFRQFSYIFTCNKTYSGCVLLFQPINKRILCFLLFELLKGRKVKHKILLQAPCIFPFLNKVSKTYFSCR